MEHLDCKHTKGKFLSTLSLRRATECRVTDCNRYGISIHALLAESDNTRIIILDEYQKISIHALLAESDGGGVLFRAPGHISIHALLAESDVPLLSLSIV